MNEVMVAVSGEFIEDKAGAEPIGRLGKDTFHLARRADPLRGLVLAVWSHAGGSGKSTLTRDLAYEMARRGYKVLVIDADPQANLTSWLGYNPVEIQKEQTLLRLVQEESLPDPLPVTFGLEAPLFDLVPANTYLALAEIHIPSKPSGMFLLRGHLRAHRERYDLILIDSPPYLGALAGLVALAGDGLIVPVETSVKGTQALSVAVDVSLEYKRTLVNLGFLSPKAEYVHLLIPTRYDPRTSQDKEAHAALTEMGTVFPLGPFMTYRPGPYKTAMTERVPVRTLADARLVAELDALAEAFLSREGLTPPALVLLEREVA